MKPVKIAINQMFAADLERELTVPHTLAIIPDQGDQVIGDILADTDVLVSGTFKAGWRSGKGPGPKLVHSVGAGFDLIDVSGLSADCKICNVFGHERGVTEQAFMMMLALRKDFLPMDAALRQGDWSPQRAYSAELRGCSLLILGFGHIGAELARWGNFMEMDVSVLTRTPGKAKVGDLKLKVLGGLAELSAQLPRADFVVIALPAAPETTDLLGEKELGLMKSTAFLINVGRAKVVNEAALYEALRTRRIAGAGLDVWYQYPAARGEKRHPSKFPLHELTQVVMSPHKASAETMAYRWGEIAKNIARFARGEPLVNQVRPA